MSKIKIFLFKYRHALMFLYAFIYIPWFAYLEKTVKIPEYIIHMKIDDYIPFNEYFIIPYLMWFGFVALAVLFFFFKNTKEFYQLTSYLFIGMTLFLIISTLFPNGQQLRPTDFARDNVFVDLVRHLYSIDTPTNIAPSIHVYNSMCVMIAIWKTKELKKYQSIRIGTTILALLIILSTMFLKQHSAFDVITGIGLCGLVYPLVYKVDYSTFWSRKKPSEEFEQI